MRHLKVRVAASFLLSAVFVLAPVVASSLSHGSWGLAQALAIGEKGAFTLPVSAADRTKDESVGATATFDLSKMLLAEDLKTLDLSSLELEVPTIQDYPAGAPTVSGNKRSVTIPAVGEWKIEDSRIVFIPASNSDTQDQSINVTVLSQAGFRSYPLLLTVKYPYISNVKLSASEGATVTIPLTYNGDLVQAKSIAFSLDGMPAGTTITADGARLIVPSEGTWTLNEAKTSAQFTPLTERLGQQPTPVNVTATDRRGRAIPPATLTINTPVITTVSKANTFGKDVQFDLGTYSTNIDPSTLELSPYSAASAVTRSADGNSITIADQGQWFLDKASSTLTFHPASDKVRDVTPMGVRGKDSLGHVSTVAPMNVGYPQVVARTRAFAWGQSATFTPLDGSLNVQALTFSFVSDDMPAGTQLTDSGRVMTVPGEGVWQFDSGTLTVTFSPEKALSQQPHSAQFSVHGVYADNETRGTLHPVYADAVPTARNDQALTNSRVNPIVVDVLGNDSPAAPGQTLQSSSLTLRSASATNIQDLVAGTGKRLVLPNQGVFEVTNAGAVRFTPAQGFVGRTQSIEYTVEDSKGLRVSATLTVDVEPLVKSNSATDKQASGVNALYSRLLPQETATFSLFASVTALLIFTGVVALWVGREMEKDALKRK